MGYTHNSRETVRDGIWDIVISWDDDGCSALESHAKIDGCYVRIEWREKKHRKRVDVGVSVITPNGLVLRPEPTQHFYEPNPKATVIARAAAYVEPLRHEIERDPLGFATRRLYGTSSTSPYQAEYRP